MGDFPIFSSYAQESGARYDGNVFRRPYGAKTPLFQNFGDGPSYASLDEFQAKRDSSGNPASQWERNGLQIIDDDPKQPLPLLDPGAIEAPIYESKQLWDLYRPGNHPEVFTPGAEYLASWPGAEGVNYRGAVGPEPLPPPGPRPGF